MSQAIVSAPASALSNFDVAKQALAEATRIDEVKDIRDKAAAIQEYARRSLDHTLERNAIKLRLRSEKKCGQLLKEGKANGTVASRGNPPGGNQHQKSDLQPPKVAPPETIQDLGLTVHQSADYQKLADVPDDEIDDYADHSTPGESTTAAAVVRRHGRAVNPGPEVEKPCAVALTIWGDLVRLEKTIVAADFGAAKFEAFMRDDLLRALPVVRTFLDDVETKLCNK